MRKPTEDEMRSVSHLGRQGKWREVATFLREHGAVVLTFKDYPRSGATTAVQRYGIRHVYARKLSDEEYLLTLTKEQDDG